MPYKSVCSIHRRQEEEGSPTTGTPSWTIRSRATSGRRSRYLLARFDGRRRRRLLT